jgi:hypothetical protein
MFPLLFLLLQGPDTVRVRPLSHPVRPGTPIDSAALGAPAVQIPTGQGTARVWLLRASDTLFVAVSIPDSTRDWRDDFVLSIDTRGDGGAGPQHDDFQWDLRRVLDSSVVYRGRNGRWEPPRDDPDWRVGRDRSGPGWEVSAFDRRLGWSILLRLDPAWLAAEGQLSRLAFRVYDNAPGGWYSWPAMSGGAPATIIEQTPEFWAWVDEDRT